MSDMKLYKILETFDKLESATDKLTEYKVDESQTRVQNMGNKVKVTTDGDTTEFDDAETAAAFMGDGDDNQFATESNDTVYDPLTKKNVRRNGMKQQTGGPTVGGKPVRANQATVGPLIRAIRDVFPDDSWNEVRNWLDSAIEYGQSTTVEEYAEWRELNDQGNMKEDLSTDFGVVDYDDFDLPIPIAPLDDVDVIDYDDLRLPVRNVEETCDSDPEFATFDSENESHRKRLQRGTPVVLDADLFTDSNVNRRGVFVNRSPSGSYGTVIRDLDGKEINIHLSDIKSADLVNNSIYEEFELNFEEMLAEDTIEKIKKDIKGLELSLKASNLSANDKKIIRNKIKTKKKKLDENITMTQTTNMENPENDTTTVTAVGNDAGEELAAMMANAGLNTGEYGAVDGPAVDPGTDVDTGEPVDVEVPAVEPVQMGMGDMMGMMGEPDIQEGEADWIEGDDFDPGMISGYSGDLDMEPSNSDLDAIDSDPEWDLNFNETAETIREDDIAYLSNEIAQAIVDGVDIYELIHDESVLQKDREGLQRDIDELMLGGDDELTAYENLAQRIYDMYADKDMAEARDIEHANTPNEIVAGVDMVTHGTSGGLNRPKRMYSPAAGGDNAMEDMYEDDMFNEANPKSPAHRDRVQWINNIPAETPANEPKSNRRAQRAQRDLRRNYGKEFGENAEEVAGYEQGSVYGKDDCSIDEELSPENQKTNDALLAKMKAEREWSKPSRYRGSRLTGKGRGTGSYARSSFSGISEAEEKKEWKKPWEDDEVVDADKDGIPGDIEELGNEIGEPDKEEVDETFVNEHESVDSFLDLYKEFTIRTKK